VATSLLVAARNRTPLVVIAAETPTGYQGAQTFDQASFVSSCEAAYRRMTPNETPADVLADALALARDESRPVVLGVAADIFTSPVGGPASTRPVPPSRVAGDDAAAPLTQLLAGSVRPVLIAGRGAMTGEAPNLIRTLAERLGAGLATTLPAKGLFDGHPLDLGIAGGLSHPAGERVLRRADLVVAFGASMGRSTTQSGRLFANAQVVKADSDAAAPTPTGTREPWFTPVGPSADCWREDLRDFAPSIPDGTVDPRRALAEISEHIPDDAVVVIGNGHCSGFAASFVTTPAKGRFFAAQGFGSIGQALTTAIGVALGAPDRKTVVFEGDAAFMMHAQEVDTASRAGANLTVFVLNDQALGTEYQRLLDAGDDADTAIVPPPDLAALGSALGARASTINTPEAHTIAEAALAPGLAIVDVRTARSVLSRHMRLPR